MAEKLHKEVKMPILIFFYSCYTIVRTGGLALTYWKRDDY